MTRQRGEKRVPIGNEDWLGPGTVWFQAMRSKREIGIGAVVMAVFLALFLWLAFD